MYGVLQDSLFWGWYAFFVSFVILQAVAAWFDGYAHPAHLQQRGVDHGWSFLEHGGMWADILIISPLCAYVLTAHTLVVGGYALVLVAVSIGAAALLGYVYHVTGRTIPQLHAHNDHTTIAGWLHNLYTVLALFVILMFYAKQLIPVPSAPEAWWVAVSLTIFSIVGMTKFSLRWRIMRYELIQVVIEIALVWAITYVLFLV